MKDERVYYKKSKKELFWKILFPITISPFLIIFFLNLIFPELEIKWEDLAAISAIFDVGITIALTVYLLNYEGKYVGTNHLTVCSLNDFILNITDNDKKRIIFDFNYQLNEYNGEYWIRESSYGEELVFSYYYKLNYNYIELKKFILQNLYQWANDNDKKIDLEKLKLLYKTGNLFNHELPNLKNIIRKDWGIDEDYVYPFNFKYRLISKKYRKNNSSKNYILERFQ